MTSTTADFCWHHLTKPLKEAIPRLKHGPWQSDTLPSSLQAPIIFLDWDWCLIIIPICQTGLGFWAWHLILRRTLCEWRTPPIFQMREHVETQGHMASNWETQHFNQCICKVTVEGSKPQWAGAAAKSLQSCLTLCDNIDSSPPGSTIPGILQARTLEWVAISFSNAWKWKVKVKLLSRVWLLVTPWTAAYQAPPSMRFSSKSTGVGCHCLLWTTVRG